MQESGALRVWVRVPGWRVPRLSVPVRILSTVLLTIWSDQIAALRLRFPQTASVRRWWAAEVRRTKKPYISMLTKLGYVKFGF